MSSIVRVAMLRGPYFIIFYVNEPHKFVPRFFSIFFPSNSSLRIIFSTNMCKLCSWIMNYHKISRFCIASPGSDAPLLLRVVNLMLRFTSPMPECMRLGCDAYVPLRTLPEARSQYCTMKNPWLAVFLAGESFRYPECCGCFLRRLQRSKKQQVKALHELSQSILCEFIEDGFPSFFGGGDTPYVSCICGRSPPRSNCVQVSHS